MILLLHFIFINNKYNCSFKMIFYSFDIPNSQTRPIIIHIQQQLSNL